MGFDTSSVGLKCGLEIHQQLGRPGDTKLFSRALADLEEGEPDIVVSRRLRASAGETGSVDVAAKAEVAKAKEYVYHGFHSTTSLIELDDEPPMPVNMECVKTVTMVAKMLNSTILKNVQFMRKTIVDGSAVSGFQRTGLMAVGGSIPGLKSPVGIQIICLEEDAAKIIEKTGGQDIFNLSRLGIPLIEIATAPDITTPEQAKEVAQQIGMILRSTGRVKRGLGTIRQDLNVSVTGGERCEIKGAQDLKMIPTIITNEAQRQTELAKMKKEIGTITISEPVDVTELFKKSSVGFVKKSLGSAIGIKIENFSGFLGRELCPNYRFGTELAGIAKTWGFGGIIHSDEDMKKYGVSGLEKAFGCKEKDAFVIVLGDEKKIRLLFDIMLIPRIQHVKNGVPGEVRKANPDGTTSYLRPIPGAARMYPETDIPIVKVETNIKAPKLITEQIQELQTISGLSKDLATQFVLEGIPIQEYKKKYPELSYEFLSSALLEWPRDVITRLKADIGDPLDYVDVLLQHVHDGTLAGSSIKAILEDIAKKEERIPPEEVHELVANYEQMSDEELIKIIDEIVKKQPDAKPNQLMGSVMAKVKGRVDGKRVMKILQEKL